MAQENVELIRTLATQLAAEADLARLFRDDDMWTAVSEETAERLHPDFESIRPGLPGGKAYAGVEGLRSAWLDWLAPWASYRIEIKEAVDCGDRVLLLVDNYGRLEGSADEVRHATAGVYTFRDRKILRWEIYSDRAEALRAVGIAE
jgi:ketosteroid isomerase-like protein